MKSKLSPFFKPFTLFPTGIQCMDKTTKAFHQVEMDKSLEVPLTSMSTMAQETKIPSTSGFMVGNGKDVFFPQRTSLQDILKNQAHIRANASPRFLVASAAKLEVVDRLQKDYLEKCKAAATEIIRAPLVDGLGLVHQHLRGIPEDAWKSSHKKNTRRQHSACLTWTPKLSPRSSPKSL